MLVIKLRGKWQKCRRWKSLPFNFVAFCQQWLANQDFNISASGGNLNENHKKNVLFCISNQ